MYRFFRNKPRLCPALVLFGGNAAPGLRARRALWSGRPASRQNVNPTHPAPPLCVLGRAVQLGLAHWGAAAMEGASAALPCPSGRYQNAMLLAAGTLMTSADDCVSCPAGAFCSTGAAEASEGLW